ncbi:MAG: phage major capsid protein [Syntrophorhabdaceae bacterium]|nr:phage major capsid protein [Syntrophorhabdaceae bacterium]MDD5243091.1 phage major capsid protein [Syntrophorhabdaceae bacterium]
MNNKSQELRQEKHETLKKMKHILDVVDSEKRVMTKVEDEDYKQMDARIDQLNKEIEAHEGIVLKRANITAELADGKKIIEGINRDGRSVEKAMPGHEKRASEIKGFSPRSDELSEADWLRCIATKDYGPLATYRAENRTGAKIGIGAAGGFAIPEVTRLAVIDGMLADQGIFSRCAKEFVEGSDTLNVATFENCDIDNEGLYGFSLPEFIAEGATITAGTPKMVQRSWTMRKLVSETKISLEAVSTGKLEAPLAQALKNVLQYGLEKYIVAGSGIGSPLGLVDSPCGVIHGRNGAGAIDFVDTYGMLAKTKLTNGNVWLASQTVIPELASMVDAGNHAVWLGNNSFDGAAGRIPSTLLGYPIIFTLGINPVLGSKGDIIFASDLSFYKIVMFGDIFVQTSEAAYWSSGEIGLRVIMLLSAGALPGKPITIGGSNFGWHTVLSA